MPPGQVIGFIIGTVIILFGAYYVTYYVGMKASGQTRAGLRNRNIKFIDRYAIARDKQFCIIEIAGKVYIVGATNHTMTLLDTYDAAEFEKLTESDSNDNPLPWNMTPVGQYGNFLTRKVVAFIAEKTGKTRSNIYETRQDNSTSGESGFAESFKEAQEKKPVQNDDSTASAANEKSSADNTESPEED